MTNLQVVNGRCLVVRCILSTQYINLCIYVDVILHEGQEEEEEGGDEGGRGDLREERKKRNLALQSNRLGISKGGDHNGHK